MENKTKFKVTKNGNPLDPKLYIWDEESKTFSTNENGLLLDFSGIDGVRFYVGSNSRIECGNNCKFVTGSYCTFNTGWFCTFNTSYGCVFDVGYMCEFNVGMDCTVVGLDTMVRIPVNKKILLDDNATFIEFLGMINTKYQDIIWRKKKSIILIRVGCQEYSLKSWKKYYKNIAESNHFPEELIPEYLEHLKSIEASLVV